MIRSPQHFRTSDEKYSVPVSIRHVVFKLQRLHKLCLEQLGF